MKLFITLSLLFLVYYSAHTQDPERFREEVLEIKKLNVNTSTENAIVFTGSSSIRLWSDLKSRFKNYNVINTGFGGSQMADMFYYAEELVIPYQPKIVFVYEGDNDLGEGEKPERILEDATKLLFYLRGRLGNKVKIVFLTPKPSIVRWHLKEKYEQYISMLKQWCEKQENVKYMDVWTPMLDDQGEVRKDLFVEDNLHMNSKGYDIWEKIIASALPEKLKVN